MKTTRSERISAIRSRINELERRLAELESTPDPLAALDAWLTTLDEAPTKGAARDKARELGLPYTLVAHRLHFEGKDPIDGRTTRLSVAPPSRVPGVCPYHQHLGVRHPECPSCHHA